MAKTKTVCAQGHKYQGDNVRITGDGYQQCITCRRISDKEWKKAKRTKPCKQCGVPVNAKAYCSDCVGDPGEGKRKWISRINLYGVDKSMYEAMVFDQGGQCLLCPREATVIDHNHITGKVRGLLCHRCNSQMGLMEDPSWRKKATEYLEEAEQW